MGRKKKYQNIEELKVAKSAQWRLYYDRNKEKINIHRMEKYYGKKEMVKKLSELRMPTNL